MTTVSTRTLKDGLSAYLQRAEKGETIVVMRGGKAVAAIVPFVEADDLDEEARLLQLAAQDLVLLPQEVPPRREVARQRVPSRGKSATAMVLEDRR